MPVWLESDMRATTGARAAVPFPSPQPGVTCPNHSTTPPLKPVKAFQKVIACCCHGWELDKQLLKQSQIQARGNLRA